MKAIKFIALGLLATMIASCSSDEVVLSKKEVTATLTGNIGSSLKTRAHETQWDTNDRIGVFVYDKDGESWRNYKNVEFKVISATSANEEGIFEKVDDEGILLPSNGDPINFQAYYPFDSNLDVDNPVYTVNSWKNQNVDKTSYNYDLLLSNKDNKPEASMENRTAMLKFHHAFTRIVLNISANSIESQLLTSDLADITVAATGMSAVASCNVLTGDLTTGDPVNETIDFKIENDGTRALAIICPNFNTINNETKVVFSLTLNDKPYTWTWPVPSDQSFLAGNSYEWNITLKGEGLLEAVLKGTIEDWGDGGKFTVEDDLEFDKSGEQSDESEPEPEPEPEP